LGLQIEEFRAGAQWALEKPELAATLATAARNAFGREEWITQLWSFSAGLRVFGEWWQQLWAESLAKRMDRQGRPAPRVSSPMACTGPRDQHSVAQQLIEGARDKLVYVLRVNAGEEDAETFTPKVFSGMPYDGRETSLGRILAAEAQAFELALTDSKIPFLSLRLESLSERSLGALFMSWQMTVALLGEKLDLNPFDQPGVELGKRHAAKILRG
jgi:glucose-6-phosphate isomerase